MLQKADVAEVLAAEARRGQSRRAVRIVITAVVVVLCLAGLIWAWFAWRAVSVPSYVTDPVTRGDIVVTLVETGSLEATQSIPVASLVNGTVASIEVDFNDTVTKGQVLARLAPEDLAVGQRRAEAAVEAAAANRDAAKATVADAQSALRRAEELDKSNLISPRDLELAESQYLRAQAGLAAADAQLHAARVDLDSAKANLAKADIVAPIDGIVLDMDVVAGQQVGPALLAPLFTIASDLAKLDLEVGVDEADVPLVAVGDRVTFTVEATPDHELHGSVRQVRSGPKISEGVTSYVAVIAVDNADLVLKPGMTATASIITDEAKDVLSVANPALRFVPSDVEGDDTEVPGVYVLKDGVPTRIPVETGISDGQRTQLLSGPEAGELVITGIGGP